ncbi:MAG TPA: acyl-CoA dehydrogenase family protein [Candidatus Limnocylindria bacterium]|nr:acyl-CoA dehydrogenase family protein [Candidatus Limnocylindria bacterium]
MTAIEPARETSPAAALPAGGSFLVEATVAGDVLTPERLTEEQRAIRQAVLAFVEREAVPRRDAIEAKDYAVHRELLAKLGRDGFVGIDVPEAFGGAGLDKTSSIVVAEALAGADTFSVTASAHTGIGTLPLVFFGSDEQRRRYLPGLADGTTVGAYALTEPSAGSDAQAIKTRATREPDGSWRLDGTKQFITNAGFADLFTIYAKVDGEQFTAFLVERGTPGLTIGPEEHKLGIHGASTCPLILDGARVPAENLLGEIGKGQRIAFNVLNMGRFKLAAAALGAMKPAIATAYAYGRDRVAFGRPIVKFPLVAAKLAGMAARTYAVESMVYRIAGLIDARLAGTESAGPDEVRAALEELAVECSIAKVVGSEELDAVVDELVQIHGGYGYIEDYPAARAYRDSRINRIWEGTNEINRLLVPGTLLKRAMAGRLDLLGPARRAQDALLAGPGAGDLGSEAAAGPLAPERALVHGVRQVTLLLAGSAVQRFGTALENQQELLAGLADLAIAVLTMESAVVRAEQAVHDAPDRSDLHLDLARLVVADRVGPAELIARSLAATVAEGDDARMLQAGTRRLLRGEPVDRIAIGRRVAAAVAASAGYPV